MDDPGAMKSCPSGADAMLALSFPVFQSHSDPPHILTCRYLGSPSKGDRPLVVAPIARTFDSLRSVCENPRVFGAGVVGQHRCGTSRTRPVAVSWNASYERRG